MFPELCEPPLDVLEGVVFRDVINKESSNCITIVGIGNGPISFLASSVPDLRSYVLIFYFDAPRGELHADRRLGIYLELVLRVSEQQVRLTHPRVADQHYFEEMVVVVLVRTY